MRWLTVAVAGSFCPGWVWLVVLLLFTGASGHAQTVEVADESADSTGSFALVEVVTDRNAEAGQPENADLSAVALAKAEHRTNPAQVTVVTERSAKQEDHRLATDATIKRKVSVAQVTVVTETSGEEAPLPPSEFNPDPGATLREEEVEQAPPELFPPILPQLPEYGEEALPRSLQLPRKGVREVVPQRRKLEYEEYPDSEAGEGLLPASEPVPNRWFIGFGRWKRYADPSTETPYQSGVKLWHPYLQSQLKGDAPIFGTQDVFANITAENFFQSEERRLPTPSGVSSERPNSSEFFGRSEQFFWSNDFSIGVDVFKGETAFKPVEWALRLLAVYNHNYIDV